MCRVGLCTGVFDLFHFGHMNFIDKAAGKCDFLMVAVASDWLTQVQKGVERPYGCEQLRLFAVSRYLGDKGYKGKAYITDMLDFTGCEWADIMFLGEDQKNVRWDGDSEVIKRTPGISTTLVHEKKVQN